eukprot:TRINITY_DN21824_c0_g1_i3.p1 TRINITY_DN21824_c0_g1~~TRINITY_DN21824_c0_g1_i3.p1  ORF type:complete len:244 (+),score=34.49 TRINITY_DN21824_c0_g1_i3:77-733(+)
MEQFLSAAAYFGTSLAMTTVNKYVVSVINFPGTNFLLLAESAVVAGAMIVARPAKVKPFESEVLHNLPQVTLAKAGNIVLSFGAMRHTSLPVYNVLKRLPAVCLVFLEFLIRGKRFSPTVLFGVFTITAGAFVTGSGDLEFDGFGYSLAILASASHACYLVLAARAADNVEAVSHVDVLFYTSLYSLFLFVPLSIGELQEAATRLEELRARVRHGQQL